MALICIQNFGISDIRPSPKIRLVRGNSPEFGPVEITKQIAQTGDRHDADILPPEQSLVGCGFVLIVVCMDSFILHGFSFLLSRESGQRTCSSFPDSTSSTMTGGSAFAPSWMTGLLLSGAAFSILPGRLKML